MIFPYCQYKHLIYLCVKLRELKALRTAVNRNKGFFSLWLLLCFLSAATARNIVPVFQEVNSTERAHDSKQDKYEISASEGDSALGTLSPKDSDVDDVEFTYYGNYSTQKSTEFPTQQHDFAEITENSYSYNIPLYDLYCNWKFHLS